MIDRMEYGEFFASVHYSAKDDLLFGMIGGISDLVTFEGASVRELRKSFMEAVEDYIDLRSSSKNELLKK